MADNLIYDTKISAASFKIKYKDFFHMKYLYKLIHDWLCEHGYNGGNFAKAFFDHENFPEILYLQRTIFKGNTEMSIWWRPSKFPFRSADNKYIKYVINIDFKILALKDAEI